MCLTRIMREDGILYRFVSPMVVTSRTGLSAAVAAAVVLSAPVLSGGGLRAEERINWLKSGGRCEELARAEVEAHRAHGGGGQGHLDAPCHPAGAAALAGSLQLASRIYRYRLAPGDRLVTSVFK